MKKYISWIISAVLAVIVILLIFSKCKHCPEGVVIHTSDTLYDSIVHRDTIKKYYPVEVILPKDTFWKDADTLAILLKCRAMYKDYYSKNVYRRILVDNEDLFAELRDTVFMNDLLSGMLNWKIRRATVVNNTTTIYGEIPRTKWWIGGGLGANISGPTDSTMRVPIGLMVTSKKNWGIEVNTDVRSLFRKEYYIEVKGYWLMNRGRKKPQTP